jgi:hypothetical protein
MLAGCSRRDPIDRLVVSITRHTPQDDLHPFPNGFWTDVHLPASATPEQLIAKLPRGDYFGALNTTNFSILKTRQVRIAYSEMVARVFDPNYTAILIQTDSGRQIVLVQFQGNSTNDIWEARIYDVK